LYDSLAKNDTKKIWSHNLACFIASSQKTKKKKYSVHSYAI